ncbi:hypothetical protein [Melittangium boletus]|uniref:hypothetical protein n=1 Tax=Melittangium boletus TaxID=83453 RepID=UPI003DA3E3F5
MRIDKREDHLVAILGFGKSVIFNNMSSGDVVYCFENAVESAAASLVTEGDIPLSIGLSLLLGMAQGSGSELTPGKSGSYTEAFGVAGVLLGVVYSSQGTAVSSLAKLGLGAIGNNPLLMMQTLAANGLEFAVVYMKPTSAGTSFSLRDDGVYTDGGSRICPWSKSGVV